MATRQQQQAKKMTAKRVKSTKEKIFNCTRGLISFDYIKEDGSWNISKIAKDTGTSRTTVYKYLKK
jgi:transcriptional regulator of acetoin/glycerol metabolism